MTTPTARRLGLRPAHRFPRHAHEGWSFGLVYTGSVRLWSAGTWFQASHGLATVLPPGEVHEGVAEQRTGLSYATVSAPEHFVAEAIGTGQTPSFERLVPADRIRRLVVAAWHTAPEERREAIIAAIAEIFPDAGAQRTPRRASDLVVAAKRALDADFLQAVNVRSLAERLDVTPPTLIRSFHEYVGLPPYAYVLSRRVDLARQLLDSGVPPAEAAQRAAFYDQAHLNRHFVRLVGVPPGSYLRS
ncbi:helix-turn-helix transcriptional regulator [Kribbella sancticallisti]|uniref:AraC family transcriptional regulator n=1 Tax=Kribbella sancticallisti TaxID=460087 RepID=UPI0031D6D5AF